jgi:hypothetical protein
MYYVESQSTFRSNILPPYSGSAFSLVSCLAYPSTLKMEMTCYSETPFDFQRTAWRYVPDDRTPDNLYPIYSYGSKFIMNSESQKERENTRKNVRNHTQSSGG